jgi:hypothetical protein
VRGLCLRCAQTSHDQRLINEPDWPDADARASVTNLASMPMDDGCVALEGKLGEGIDAVNFELGGAAHLSPERVSASSKAISMLSEASLRVQLDFEAMDENDGTAGFGLGKARTPFVPTCFRRFNAFRRSMGPLPPLPSLCSWSAPKRSPQPPSPVAFAIRVRPIGVPHILTGRAPSARYRSTR